MTTTVNLRKLLHRKAWESCTSSPAVTNAGAFVVNDRFNLVGDLSAALVTGVSAIYIYQGKEDAWQQIPNSGIAGTYAAGACGCFRGFGAMGGSFTQTATAGTTTTITTNRTIVKGLTGCKVRVIAGAGVGYEGAVVSNTLGANAVLTVTPASAVAFGSTTQYQVYSGSVWFMNAGTTAVGFSVYDLATNVWTARSVTGLPTAWGTDGKLIPTGGAVSSIATGTATAGGASTLTNSAKTWATNMWANYQVRITGGTGQGQIRTVSSNTGTVLTVSAAWTVTPDATSTYSIEGNDDYLYLFGNNAVAIYRYSVAANTWTLLAPVAARAAVAGAGCTGSWIESAPGWDNETQVAHYSTTVFKQNARYIYSFRGGGSSWLDIYDIAANTWISTVSYGGQLETFTTGSSAVDVNGGIHIGKEATGRLFRLDVDCNCLQPLATNTNQAALGGTAVAGDKLFILSYTDGGTTINFLYALRNSAADLVRMLLV